jgi:hypothetical protein
MYNPEVPGQGFKFIKREEPKGSMEQLKKNTVVVGSPLGKDVEELKMVNPKLNKDFKQMLETPKSATRIFSAEKTKKP